MLHYVWGVEGSTLCPIGYVTDMGSHNDRMHQLETYIVNFFCREAIQVQVLMRPYEFVTLSK